MEHVDNLLKLKEERIDELQKQLERKQTRRKETETLINSLCVPFDTVPNPAPIKIENSQQLTKENSQNQMTEEPIVLEKTSLKSVSSKSSVHSKNTVESKHSVTDSSFAKEVNANDCYALVHIDLEDNLERIKSDVFKDIDNDAHINFPPDAIEFKNIVQDPLTTIADSIQREIKGITIHPLEYNIQKANYQ